MLWAVEPRFWPVVALAGLFRAAAAWAVAGWVLHDPLTRKQWGWVPVQDLISFFRVDWGILWECSSVAGPKMLCVARRALSSGSLRCTVGERPWPNGSC